MKRLPFFKADYTSKRWKKDENGNKIEWESELETLERGIRECNGAITQKWLAENTLYEELAHKEYDERGWSKIDTTWGCECGQYNEGDFCERCGLSREEGECI